MKKEEEITDKIELVLKKKTETDRFSQWEDLILFNRCRCIYHKIWFVKFGFVKCGGVNIFHYNFVVSKASNSNSSDP